MSRYNLSSTQFDLERYEQCSAQLPDLGLAIYRNGGGAMGGRIWLTSGGVPGDGSTFSFTLKQGIRQGAGRIKFQAFRFRFMRPDHDP